MKYTIAALVFLLPAAFNADAPDAKPSFATAEVTVLLNAEGKPLAKPKVISLTAAEKVSRLASFFPQLGHGDSGIAGGWVSAVEVKLITADGKAVRVTVDPDYKTWSEGKGDWKAKAGLKKFIDGLIDDAKPSEK